MSNILKITTVGNSAGIVLPREILERLRVEKGDTLYALETPNGIELTPYDPFFSAQMDVATRVIARTAMLFASWHSDAWITVDAALAIHNLQIAEHGGREGLRDGGLLESAIVRAQNISSYKKGVSVAELAAAYAFGIAKNHPFLDGNKRTALVVMRTFLILNGFDVKASQEEKYLTLMNLADGNLSEETLKLWIQEHLEKIQT